MDAGVEQVRMHSPVEVAAILDTFQKHGHDEVDSVRVYGDGSSGEHLGRLDLGARHRARHQAGTGYDKSFSALEPTEPATDHQVYTSSLHVFLRLFLRQICHKLLHKRSSHVTWSFMFISPPIFLSAGRLQTPSPTTAVTIQRLA